MPWAARRKDNQAVSCHELARVYLKEGLAWYDYNQLPDDLGSYINEIILVKCYRHLFGFLC